MVSRTGQVKTSKQSVEYHLSRFNKSDRFPLTFPIKKHFHPQNCHSLDIVSTLKHYRLLCVKFPKGQQILKYSDLPRWYQQPSHNNISLFLCLMLTLPNALELYA